MNSGENLDGKISDRIRSGEIPEESLNAKRIPVDNSPSDAAVKGGKGQALGDPARSDRHAATHEE